MPAFGFGNIGFELTQGYADSIHERIELFAQFGIPLQLTETTLVSAAAIVDIPSGPSRPLAGRCSIVPEPNVERHDDWLTQYPPVAVIAYLGNTPTPVTTAVHRFT